MLGNLVGGFVVILVGVTLAPTVADEVAVAQQNGSGVVGGIGANISGASSTIIGLTTLFYSLAIATVAMGMSVAGLRQGGLM